MKLKIIALLCALSLLNPTYANAQGGVSAADFLPPAKGGTKKVKNRDAVKIKDNVVTAETAQDALNEAMSANQAALTGAGGAAEESQFANLGFKWVKYGSGVGLLATGMGTYSEVANPNATRLAQRSAYVIAYLNAKATIAQAIGAVTIDDNDTFAACVKQIDTANKSETANAEQLQEISRQAANALLKGYVTYSINEVKDSVDPSVRFVFVSLASSPKTQKLVQRQGAMREVESIVAGIDEVIADIQTGIVPPVGGRVVNVSGDDQTAIVGFGSALINSTANRAVFAKNRLNARRISEARARSSLVGIINGDRVIWQTGINSQFTQNIKAVQAHVKDPLEASNNQVKETIALLEFDLVNNQANSESVKSIRRGTLPPGVTSKTWESEDGHWVYTMMVYLPELTNFAASFAKKMQEADLIAPVNANGAAPDPTRTIDGKVRPLKGGKVSPDDDL